MNNDYTANISYPIEILYDADKLVPLAPLPTQIKFNATGYGWNFLRKTINFNERPIFMRPTDLPEKEFLTADEILPLISHQLTDIKINYVLVDTLFLNFDHRLEKKAYVKVDKKNISLAPGYRIVSPIEINPSEITLAGPEKLISEYPDTIVIKIADTNIKKDYDKKIPLEDDLKRLMVDPQVKAVDVKFQTIHVSEESLLLSVRPINFPPNYPEVKIENIKIVYSIKDEDKGKATPEDFIVLLNFANINDGHITPELSDKPEYILDYYFVPSTIKIPNE